MDESLFPAPEPLPQRMRPRAWSDFVGQSDLVRVLRSRGPHSLILYGPPGSGKTTIARLVAADSGMPLRALSAVSAGVKDVREVLDEARQMVRSGQRLLLFVDEIHRFNKAQQDALLEAVEAGWVVFIGATTENPSFEVIGPLLSRCQVYRLFAHNASDLDRILDRALAEDPALDGIRLTAGARSALVEAAGGDARRMLRILEVAAGEGAAREIQAGQIADVLQGAVRNYDKLGAYHYDYASAFIKSLRGSDPDAALLYLAAMLDGGEDPIFIARRLVIFASEDVDNAAPTALGLAVNAFLALERIGMPEGRIILGQAVTFLASCPKSNASYKAVDAALDAVRGKNVPVPDHIRNAPTATHRAEGAGRGYRYPHDFPGHFVEAEYRPPGFEQLQLYFPTSEGQEARLKDRLRGLWKKRNYGSAAPLRAPDEDSAG